MGCPIEDQDLDADGNLRRTRAFRYDDQGNLAGLDYVRADGKVTTRLLFKYAHGAPDAMEVHDGSDGSLMGGQHYHAKGDTISREQFDESNQIVRKASYHAKDGKFSAAEVDNGADGTVDVKIRAIYQGGHLTRMETSDGKGALLGVSTYHYDCPARP